MYLSTSSRGIREGWQKCIAGFRRTSVLVRFRASYGTLSRPRLGLMLRRCSIRRLNRRTTRLQIEQRTLSIVAIVEGHAAHLSNQSGERDMSHDHPVHHHPLHIFINKRKYELDNPIQTGAGLKQLAGISLVYVKRIQINGPRDGVLEVRLECLEYNSEVQRQSRAHAPRPRVGAGSALGSTDTGNFVRGTAFDAQPAGNAPATPPSAASIARSTSR